MLTGLLAPTGNLNEISRGRIQHDASLEIIGAVRAGVAVRGDCAKDALHVTLRSLLHLSANLLIGGLLLQLRLLLLHTHSLGQNINV